MLVTKRVEKMTSEQLAWRIRRHGIEMTHLSGGSHIGAILSVADIIAVLYAYVMKYDPENPQWDGRDRMILSKGHAGASIYAALAESGFFPVEELKTHYADGSRLSGHVSHHVPGVDFSTGSLGHGLSAGAGMAYALKKDGKTSRVFVVMGDGECDEGSVWEAALFANHYRLDNLIAVVDHNRMQDELKKAFKEIEVKHNIQNDNKPSVIIANTTKGCGVSFMENDILWHYRFPHTGWEYDGAVTELHAHKPDGVTDPYTPNGIQNPVMPDENADIYKDHTTSYTWKHDYLKDRKRITAPDRGTSK